MMNNNPYYMWYIFCLLSLHFAYGVVLFFHTEVFNFYGAKNVNHFFCSFWSCFHALNPTP